MINNASKTTVYLLSASSPTGTWSQSTHLSLPSSYTGTTYGFGSSVKLSYNGNVLVVGGNSDTSDQGALWVYNQNSTGGWYQYGSKLYVSGTTNVGYDVAMSSDGTTIIAASQNTSTSVNQLLSYVLINGQYILETNLLINGTQSGEFFSIASSADTGYTILGSATQGAIWGFV